MTPWLAARQAFLSFTVSQSLLKFMSLESVMPSNHLILCCPLLLLPSIFPSIRVFSNESAPCIRWPKYWSFSFSMVLSEFLQRGEAGTSLLIHWLRLHFSTHGVQLQSLVGELRISHVSWPKNQNTKQK